MCRRFLFFLLTFIVILGLGSCGNHQPADQSGTNKTSEVKLVAPDYNADSAYAFVQKQVDFGPRVLESKAHSQCEEFLTSTLKRFAPEVQVQHAKVRGFDEKIYNIANIIGSFNPGNSARILLCAHWDSRPFADHDPDPANYKKPIPGANDGASGVGILLEVARQFRLKDPGIGVDIIFFDAEDFGQPQDMQPQKEDTWCLGSQYWSMNPHKPAYMARFGILLDMVGAGGATFFREEYSEYIAPDVVSKVWEAAARLGFSNTFINRPGGGVTDDHVYVNKNLKIPVIDIIQQDEARQHQFYENWHTMKDDMQFIDRNMLKMVGQTLLLVVYESSPKPS